MSTIAKSKLSKESNITNKLTKSLNSHFNKLFLNYYSQKDFSYTPNEFKGTQREKTKNKGKEEINKNKSKLEYCDNSTLTSEQNYKEVIKAKEKEINHLKNELLQTQKMLNDINKQITIASIKHNKISFDSFIDKTYLFSNNITDSCDEYNSILPFEDNNTINYSLKNKRSSRSVQIKMKTNINNQFSLLKNTIINNKKTNLNVNESLCLLKTRTEVLLNKVFSTYVIDKKK